MIGSFTFDGINSESFKLVCKSGQRPLLPPVKTKRISLPGLSGAYDFDGDVDYDLRPVTMKIQFIGTSYEERRLRARSIAAWLGAPTWARLIINDEPDKYYLAKVTEGIDMETLWESSSADVVFDCQPFAYSLTETTETFAAVGATTHEFVNQGTRLINYRSPLGSKFLIEINGTWSTLSVTFNGSILTYNKAGNGLFSINNVDMEVLMAGQNVFGDLGGAVDTFFKLLPGENTITIGGTNVNVTVNIKYISLWM
jgi:predicted phage tail component-like protein